MIFFIIKSQIKKILLLFLLNIFSYSAVLAEGPVVTEGFDEVVIIAADHNVWAEFFNSHAGWKIIDEGISDKNWMEYWGLSNYQANYKLYQNPGTNKGRVRVIRFKNSDGRIAPSIRPHSQSWDTGGIFDFNLRVKDLDYVNKSMTLSGWKAPTEPIEFRFGKFHVKEWLPVGPDSVQIALIERISPSLKGWPALNKMSRTFNATMIVDDLPAAEKFWRDMLGFKIYLYHKGASPEPGNNVLGLPHNLASSIHREVYVLHPKGKNDGSIELLKFHGATGRDFSKHTDVPNRGISSLRFSVEDIDKLLLRAEKFGFTPIMKAENLDFLPDQKADFVALRAPGGAIIEFYHVLDKRNQ